MSTATITLGRQESVERLARRLAGSDEALLARFHAVRAFSRTIRSSEYHVTNACNIRCRGCWFFTFDFDKQTKDQTDLAALRAFIQRERARHINAALLIGGEPTLVPDRIMAFVEGMEYITISTNGVRPLPRDGFERVSVAITLFGGGPLDDALRVGDTYPDTVLSHPYYLRALINGQTEFGRFGYNVCPSVSWDHPAHATRRANGNPTLPLFNVYAPDLTTIHFCCTSGHCEGCRDSQAVQSWLLVSARQFLHSEEGLRTWVELAETYWRQFVWSPYHALSADQAF